MPKFKRAGIIIPIVLILISGFTRSSGAGQRSTRKPTALDRYVAKPDSNYHYKLVNTVKSEASTTYILEMTSQQWRTESEVDRPIWVHWLTIVQPSEVRSSTGFLFIEGGSNGSKPPAGADAAFTSMAVTSHTVVSVLRMVPNEPLTFKGETASRTEDGIIAYTWDKFLKTGDDTWPLRLPMTKSAVRAMDTITDFCGGTERGKTAVNHFVVAGGSKRGWTTWTTAAVDDRVIAIMPFVIDVLNNEKSMEHHYRAYGFWAPAIGDYTASNLMEWSGTPQYRALMQIEDPYSYLDRLTMPKFIVNSTGDQYFLPDSWQFYYDDLKGEKYLRYVPNTKHNLANSDARESLASFYESIINETPRPKFSWKIEKDGSTVLNTVDKPTEVKLWQATNPKARDFRLDSIGSAYVGSMLAPGKEGVYRARVAAPPQGWTAYFIEMTYPSGGKYPFKFSTGVRITPESLPGPPPPKGKRDPK